jgi:hypothetical protein
MHAAAIVFIKGENALDLKEQPSWNFTPTSRNAVVPKEGMLCSSQPLHKPLSI